MITTSFYKKARYLLEETFRQFIADNAIKLSASLSYYTIYSIPPLLIIIISVSGLYFGDEAASGEMFGHINGFVGAKAAMHIQETIRFINLSGSNVFATVIGIIVLMIGASGVFAEIQESINYIWGIKTRHKRGVIKFIRNRIMSFSMIGSVGILFLLGLILSSLVDVLDKRLTVYLPEHTVVLFQTISVFIVFVLMVILFTVIFRTLPDGKIALRDCLIGAIFTAVLFMIGKIAIGAYLSSPVVATIYGAVGSVILILTWVYYSAIILYFGAEFTKIYAYTHGKKIIPNSHSIQFIKQEKRIKPGRSYK